MIKHKFILPAPTLEKFADGSYVLTYPCGTKNYSEPRNASMEEDYTLREEMSLYSYEIVEEVEKKQIAKLGS